MNTILGDSKISPELKKELLDIVEKEKCTLMEAEGILIMRYLTLIKKKNDDI